MYNLLTTYYIDKIRLQFRYFLDQVKGMNANMDEASFNQTSCDQYVITLEFELQRQKQKNKILQQRLRNKQIFIVEMKKMQSQIQLLSEKCREQLLQQRERRAVLERTTLRDYVETIAELQHKIKYLQALQDSKKLSKFDQKLLRNKQMQKQALETKSREMNRQKQQRSQILKNFANRFLQMFEMYSQTQREGSMKKSLKAGWKWIKKVVRQWEQNSTLLNQIFEYAHKCVQNQYSCDASQILKFRQEQQQQNEDEQP